MSPRVLIVEPYADLRAEIAATLRREHFTCDTVATAAAARLELGRSDYAYVIVDLDAADELGPTRSPMILLTQNDMPGEDDLETLRKPFSRDELIARLTN